MADYYVDSVSGSGAGAGTSWGTARDTVANAIALLSAGDRLIISSRHVEGAADMDWLFPGTNANPNVVISAQFNQSPDVYETMFTGGGKLDCSIGTDVFEGVVRCYGITVETNGIMIPAKLTSNASEFNECRLTTTHTSGDIIFTGNANGEWNVYRDCIFTVAKTAAYAFEFGFNNGWCHFMGCTFNAASMGSATDDIVLFDQLGCRALFEGCDLSNMGSAKEIAFSGSQNEVIFRGCKLPTSWTITGNTDLTNLVVLEASDGGANPSAASPGLRHQEDLSGIITHETTEIRTGGANDGDNDYSWKYAPTTTVGYHVPLWNRVPLTVWHDASGSKTLTVFLSSADSALTNKDVWMDVISPAEGTASYKNKFATTRGNPFSTTGLTSDSSTWTTGGNTKYKLTATLNPVEPGPVIVRVSVAKDADVFVDPELSLA